MKPQNPRRKPGFSLVETIIAIGVLTVLLTGFLIVFAPAAAGIRRAISVQEADRLTSTVEQELVVSRGTEPTPGFNKAFEWIKDSNSPENALLVYQYRGSLSSKRLDDTPDPVADVADKVPGRDFAVQSIVRRKGDANLIQDLAALEGGIYLVKCTQLVFNDGELRPGPPGQIVDPKGDGPVENADAYPEAVIAFAAEFYALPARSPEYVSGNSFDNFFNKASNPVFIRNLAVRR